MGNIMRRHSAPPASPPTSPPPSPTSLPTSLPVLRIAPIDLRTLSPASHKLHNNIYEDFPPSVQYVDGPSNREDTHIYKAICRSPAFKRKGEWDDDRCDAPIYQSPRKQTTAELKQRLTLTTTWDWPASGFKASPAPHSTAKLPKVFPSSAIVLTPGTALDVWASDCIWKSRAIDQSNKVDCECGLRICAHLRKYEMSFPCATCEGKICEDCWLARNKA